MEIQTPRERHVPFRKNRDMFARIIRYLRRTRPIPGGLLELTPGGFRVKTPLDRQGGGPAGSRYIPPFWPSLSQADPDSHFRYLYIYKGWVRGPYQPETPTFPNQVAAYLDYPLGIPKIAGTQIDDLDGDPIPRLTMKAGETNVVCLETTYTPRIAPIAPTSLYFPLAAQTLYGATVEIEDHSSLPTEPHYALTYPWDIHYHWSGAAFRFVVFNSVSPDGATQPEDTATLRYIRFGWYALDADGTIDQANSDWTIHNDYYMPAPSYASAGDSGHSGTLSHPTHPVYPP